MLTMVVIVAVAEVAGNFFTMRIRLFFLIFIVLLSACSFPGSNETPLASTGTDILSSSEYQDLVKKVQNTKILDRMKEDLAANALNWDFFMDSLAYLVGEKRYSKETLQAYANIDHYIIERTNTWLIIDEISYPLGNIFLFQYVNKIEECDILQKSYGSREKNFLKKDCEFQVYLKSALNNPRIIVPTYMQEYNSIFSMITTGDCKIPENYTCFFLSNEKTYPDFIVALNDFVAFKNLLWTDVARESPPANYGALAFSRDVYALKDSEIKDAFYDSAMLIRIIQKKSEDLCSSLKFQENQMYCRDLFDNSKKEQYQVLYREFFIKNYLREIEAKLQQP
jgi:hypothetical protein